MKWGLVWNMVENSSKTLQIKPCSVQVDYKEIELVCFLTSHVRTFGLAGCVIRYFLNDTQLPLLVCGSTQDSYIYLVLQA